MSIGLISVSKNSLGRYSEFDQCLANIKLDTGRFVNIQRGVDIAFNFNKSILEMLRHNDKSKDSPSNIVEWIWMLGDDHVFPPDLLKKLLDRNVEIVVPLYLHRTKPLQPVLQREVKPGKMEKMSFDDLPERTKLWRLPHGVYTGNAGMLVRRSVFDKMGYPWMEQGQLVPGRGGFDLYFCKKAQDLKIPVHLDLENIIGHMTHVGIWPEHKDDGSWSYRFEVE